MTPPPPLVQQHRIPPPLPAPNPSQHKSAKNEWVICRVFHKSSGLKNKIECLGDVSRGSSLLPPLMDVNPTSKNTGPPAHVTCFSNAMEGLRGHEDQLLADYYYYNTPILSASTVVVSDALPPSSLSLGMMPLPGNLYAYQGGYGFRNMQFPGASLVQLLESNIGHGMKHKGRCSVFHKGQGSPVM